MVDNFTLFDLSIQNINKDNHNNYFWAKVLGVLAKWIMGMIEKKKWTFLINFSLRESTSENLNPFENVALELMTEVSEQMISGKICFEKNGNLYTKFNSDFFKMLFYVELDKSFSL